MITSGFFTSFLISFWIHVFVVFDRVKNRGSSSEMMNERFTLLIMIKKTFDCFSRSGDFLLYEWCTGKGLKIPFTLTVSGKCVQYMSTIDANILQVIWV